MIRYVKTLPDQDWEALSGLYERTGFSKKSIARLKNVFGNSQYQVFAYQNNVLIGAARAFTDGGDCAVICDVSVSEELQGKGIGKEMTARLLEMIGPHERVMLFSTLGKEGFYKQFGFGLMTTGMCLFKNQKGAIEVGYIEN